MLDLRITGGEVIDGTGTPRRRADVGIRDGRVVAVGTVDEPAARTIAADGLIVSPGFIDPHTHYDAQVFWDPAATPSPLHGVTTVLGGNCGFTIAPMADAHADYLRRMLAVVEGMPLESLEQGVPWGWSSFAEWLDVIESRGLTVNAGFGVGHSTIRRLVMGTAAGEAAATPAQVEAMQRLAHESLAAGAIAFTTSLSTAHHDGDGHHVPSFMASPDELVALCATVRDHAGTTLGIAPPVGPFEQPLHQLLTDLSVAGDRPLYWNVLIIDANTPEQVTTQLATTEYSRARGGAVIALTVPDLMRLRLSFDNGVVLAAVPGWGDVLALPRSARLRALADRSVRERMRAQRNAMPPISLKRLMSFESITIGATVAPQNARYSHRTVGDIANELGIDAFDAMLDIVVADELGTEIWPQPPGDDDQSWKMRAELWRDPRVVFGGGDGGAHLDMASTYQYFSAVVGPHVRDRGLLSLEEAVHLVTGEPAFAFGLTDRGVLAPGARADVTIFDATTIGPEPLRVVADLPAGASRLFNGASGIAHVLVNGVEVVRDGALTGERGGRLLRSGRDTHTVSCSAYWQGMHVA